MRSRFFARLCLAAIGLLLVLCMASCLPYQVYNLPTAAPQEINQHRRRAKHARHGKVRQRQLPRSKPEWRQRY